MYGYVRIFKEELKIKEYELYRGLYCSLCKALGKEYGIVSRLLLTYDVTFLVLMLVGISGIDPSFKKGRCPFNPSKRCCYCVSHNSIFSFAAAVSIFLMYYKIKDNIIDSSFFKKLAAFLILPYIKRKFKKASGKFPALALEIAVRMNNQQQVELSNTKDVDEAALNSAECLGLIFAESDNSNVNLYNFGCALGRWVYLIDAADDLEKDIKSKSFNVFANKFQISAISDLTEEKKGEIKNELNLSMGIAVSFLKNLQLNQMQPIIENIIFDGTKAVENKIFKEMDDHEGSI